MLTSIRPSGIAAPRQKSFAQLPRIKPDIRRVAVLLNRNARRVTPFLTREIEAIVGPSHVYQSDTLDEAEGCCREIVQRGYGTVVCGGGDGTLMQAVNMVQRYLGEANAWRTERFTRFGEWQALLAQPRFAALKLGTGNGMSQVVGSHHPTWDLKRIVDYAPMRTQSVPLIEMDGERFFFGGMGYDSVILDDYNWIKSRAKNRLFKALMQNVSGYLIAVFGRTIPRMLTGRVDKIEARVVNLGRAYYVDPRRGDVLQEVPAGEVLFEGDCRIIAAGTTPFFGYGFRVFPFARMSPDLMQLRIGKTGPMRLLPFLPSLWRGTYRNPDQMFDFLVERVSVELKTPYPFQHSGDAQGMRDRLDLHLADDKLELVDLYPPRRPT